jgi:FkbM family methyltransferase
MNINALDRYIADVLPGDFLKDTYTRGMRRLAEYGFFTKESIVRTRYGFQMYVGRLDAIRWNIHYFGHFEPQISKAWYNLLQAGDTVVDIGGNVGYHALLAGKCVGITGKVFTFEPSTRIYSELLENIKLNPDVRIEARKLAVSDKAGNVSFYFAGENAEGNSSIMADRGVSVSETVTAISFDEISEIVPLHSVDLIKIDVEGAEVLVLRSLSQHLAQLNPKCVIFVEISASNVEKTESILAPFIEQGFHIRQIGNEYTTSFYRRPVKVELKELSLTEKTISDLVLCRDERQFKVISK